MTKQEFAVIVKGLKAVYSAPSFIPDKDAFNVWYEMLKDIPYAQASAATRIYMATQKKIPTIADIRENVAELQLKARNDGKGFIPEAEAWSMVKKALSNGIYGYNEEWEKLPPEIQRAMGSARNIHDLAASNDTNLDVQESLFYRRYRVEVDRAREKAKLMPTSTKLMEQKNIEVPQQDTKLQEYQAMQ